MDKIYSLKGKTAWITGGKRIGQKVAELFAKNGADLVLSSRDSDEEAESALKRASKFGIKSMALKVDVSSRDDVFAAVTQIKKKFKKIDILVLMASVFEPVELTSISEEHFKSSFDAHVLGTFWPVQASLGLMPRGSSGSSRENCVSLNQNTSLIEAPPI